MKTNLFLRTLAIFLFTALIYQPTNGQTNTFPASGKVGVGTATPSTQLEILAPAISGGERLMKFSVSDAANDYLDITNATGSNSVFAPTIRGNVISSPTISLMFIGQTDVANDTGINPVTVFDSRFVGSKISIRPLFGWSSYGARYMTMLANGNLGIGTSTPNEKLAVNGKIRAHEIKVETANWPDYVFAKDYDLPSLKETEKHIQ
nr:hypothetical protein [Pedobacter panaciterrae]